MDRPVKQPQGTAKLRRDSSLVAIWEDGEMKRQSVLVPAIVCVVFFAGNASADLTPTYLSIENIGALPIWSFKVTFDIAPRGAPWPGYDFEIMSSGLAYSALVDNMILHHDPIAPGETYYSPRIPQLEDVTFSVREFNIAGPYVYSGDTYFWREVVLDESYFTNDPWNGYFAATLRFHSGVPGPEPVPVPGAVLLGVLGLGTAGWKLRRGNLSKAPPE